MCKHPNCFHFIFYSSFVCNAIYSKSKATYNYHFFACKFFYKFFANVFAVFIIISGANNGYNL